MFKVSYFMEVLPVIASKVNVTFELTIAATIFALLVGVVIAVIGYYKVPVLSQLTRVYVSVMRGTPVVAQLYFFYYGIALYSNFGGGSGSYEFEYGGFYVRKHPWCTSFCR